MESVYIFRRNKNEPNKINEIGLSIDIENENEKFKDCLALDILKENLKDNDADNFYLDDVLNIIK